MQEQLGSKPKEFYSEHEASVIARDEAIEYAADTQHRLDSDPDGINDLEMRAFLQEKNDQDAQHARNRVDANLWRSHQHYRQNEAAYQEQAIKDAEDAGVNVKLDSKAK